MFKSILVLESSWDSKWVQSTSVSPFVSEFAKVIEIESYHQVFTDKQSFCHWIERFNKQKTVSKPKLLYIAAHAESGRILGLHKKINFETIIKKLKTSKNIHYLHFGSCSIGNEDNLTLLLDKVKHIKWVAGYNKSVDWIDSTIFDIMLLGRIATRDKKTKGLKSQTIVKDLVENEVTGLADNLGFQFVYRYGKTIYKI